MNTVAIRTEYALHVLANAEQTDYIGEPVSQLTHSLQAAYFAELSGHSQEVILASLFHDIGHFIPNSHQFTMNDLGIVHHEWLGAKLLYTLGFSAKVALLVGNHVEAKRYLAGKKSSYYARLSPASRGTLVFQGGPMNAEEIVAFERHPYFKDILKVRVNDEKGKELHLNVPGLDYYREIITEHLQRHNAFAQDDPACAIPDYVDKQWVEQFKKIFSKMGIPTSF